MKGNEFIHLYKIYIKPFLKPFLWRLALTSIIIASFYYSFYYWPKKITAEEKSAEYLMLNNLYDKLKQVNEAENNLSQHNTLDANNLIQSITLYRENTANALAISKEISTISQKMINAHKIPFSKKFIFALAKIAPKQDLGAIEPAKISDEIYQKTIKETDGQQEFLNYFLETQKALRNLFEYIPELDFRGLSVSNGKSHFITRLDLANAGLSKIIDKLNLLKNNNKFEDSKLEDIISNLSNLRAAALTLKQAVILGDHKTTESIRADFALSVMSDKKTVMKNRIDFFKNYLEKNKVAEKLDQIRFDIKQTLSNVR